MPRKEGTGQIRSVSGSGSETPASVPAQQQQLAQKATHLQALIECSRDLVWSVDREYRLVTFNSAYAANVKSSSGINAAGGMSPADLAPGDHAERWPELYERAMREGPYRLEYPLDDRWFELFFNPILSDDVPTGVSVFGADITERRNAEKRVAASEARFRTLVENAPCAVGISRNGVTLYANRRYAEMFRVDDPATLQGRPLVEFWAPEWRARIADWSMRRMRGEDLPTEWEGVGQRDDGSQFPLRIAVTRVELLDGPATIGYLIDESQRRSAEETIRQSAARLRSFFDMQLVGMVVTSPERGFLEMNDRACEILGYSRDELLTMHWSDITHPDDLPSNLVAFDQTRSGNNNGFALEKRFIRKDRQVIWTKISVSSIRGADGAVDHLCAVLEDISERKAAEEAIKEAEREFRQIFEQAPEGIFKSSPAGEAISLNPTGARMLGYESSEEAVSAIRDLAHQVWAAPEEREAYLAELELRGEVHDMQCQFKRKDGSLLWISMTARRVLGEDGNTSYYQGYFENLSEKKRLEEELSEHLREVKLLSELNEALLRARSEKELLEEYCRIIVQAGGYRMAWVGFAQSEPEKCVVPVAWFGQEDGYLSEIKVRWDGGEWSHGPTAKAVVSGQIEVAQDFENDSRLQMYRAKAKKRGFKSSIAVPFHLSTDAVAVLTAYGSTLNAWSETERRLMDQVAGALGFGINTLRNEIAKDQYQRDLRASLEQTIQVIAGTIDQRDPYTAGHQRRVADLCTQIARKMGLDENRVHGLHLAASIHDLGKVGVPAEILSKPGRLTAIQYSLIKEHAQMGYEIVRGVQFPWPIADMVWQHHERMDGSGYPRGLKGESILLESRILAVADTVEVMATHRPYRASLGINAALEEIELGRGVQFDAEVVDACVRVFREDGYTLPAQTP